MRVLIVGARRTRARARLEVRRRARASREVLVAPGNAGTAREPKVRNAAGRRGRHRRARAARARRAHRSYDRRPGSAARRTASSMRSRRRASNASGRARAARSSRARRPSARNSCAAISIPTARRATFTRDNFDAAYVRSQRTPLVVKASGLAAGKGVVIAASIDEAHRGRAAPCLPVEFGECRARGGDRGVPARARR